MVLENLPEMIASSEEKKKSSKPLMEKRRRARINQSLNELKNLILEALNKDTSCYSKLEKADILEMTVSYLRSLKRQQLTAAPASPDPSALAKYRAGFNECASEVSRYLMSLNGMDTQVRSTLLAHLADCCNPVKSSSQETDRIQSLPQQYSPLAFGPANGPLFSPTYAKPASDTSILNGATQFQIVPGQLANGKIAAVLVPASTPTSATIVQAAPQIIPVFRPDFRTPQAFQLQGQALRADTDPLWRPW